MTRTLIIGDIHGCYDELRELLDAAAVASDDVVVSVGDLVDRGPKPREVVDWFRARPGAVVLMGNHERKHVRAVFSYSQEVTRLQFGDGYADAVAWMRGLPYYLELPEIRVVHAALIPGVPLAAQDEAVLAGTTAGEAILRAAIPEGWWHERYADPVPVAFGHHVVGDQPLVREGAIYGLDTGACHGGRLTALSVPDFTLYSVPAREDHWKTSAQAYQVPVLRTRAWATMGWAKLDETIAERREHPAPEADAYLDAVATWAGAIRALIPDLVPRVIALDQALRAEHGAGYAAIAAAHPAKPLLFKLARGRLTLEDVQVRCGSAAATLALAAKLGVEVGALATPP
ncbi:MAG: metallophosphoesterase [Deltaproteobacteria bacterium]|nr:metallophosphoesterase [Deltaproteobacteria bacterium]